MPAPDFPPGHTWFNVERPINIESLRGKAVLLDFWTAGCINCQHIIPDLKRLEAEFEDSLVVIGVHSGKYEREHEDAAVRQAIGRYGIEHPVVNDPDFVIWRTFGARAWPTVVLIDPAGNLVGGHAGEGVYPLFQPILTAMLEEFEAKGMVDRSPLPALRPAEGAVASSVLSYPSAVLADPAGRRLFIADAGHNRILVAGLDGSLRDVIGSGAEGYADGSFAEAAFRQPQGLALSADGRTLYVADTRNHAVRAVDLESRNVATIAGTGEQLDRLPNDGALARQAAMASPWGLALQGETLYVSMAGVHQIWSIDLTNGTVSLFAGTSREGIDDGLRRTEATLAQPSGMATDGRELFWVDPESSSLRRVELEGEDRVRTIVGTGLFDFGDRDGVGRVAQFEHPQGLTYGDGLLFVADTYNHRIKQADPVSERVTTIAGDGEPGWQDGPALEARLDEPTGLSWAEGRLFIADSNNHLVRILDLASGQLSTLTLTNLGVLSAAGEERPAPRPLPQAVIGDGRATLRVVVSLPAGYELNAEAPSRLHLFTSGNSVARLSREELDLRREGTDFTVDLQAAAGAAEILVTGPVYYCRHGEEALCFIEQVNLALPLRVDPGGPPEARLEIALPPAPRT
jgi:thiol-disulfide isomerase/thioredoxin